MKIKALIFALMFFGAICASAVYVPDAEAKCIYCGSENKGDCGKAPHNDSSNPKRKHKHHSDGRTCVWCKISSPTETCSDSPTGKHQRS